MKTAVALLSCLSVAQGFTSTSSARQAVPLAAGKEVEIIGALPPVGMLGKTEWKKFTTEIGSAATGDYLRASEVKHGRAAMLATVGFAFQKFGITFDKFTPHEYLSITQGIKFADLAAMGPIAAVKAVPVEGLAQVFAAIAAIEIYELTHRDGEIKEGQRIPPGLQAGGLTGYNLNFNPLNIKVDDRRKLVEIQNGRAAMFAITAWVCAETIPGSVPIPLLW